jgi:hypothetical protein
MACSMEEEQEKGGQVQEEGEAGRSGVKRRQCGWQQMR